MDVANSGTEGPVHLNTAPRPNKPPVLSKKPKPVLPRKPSLAQKSSDIADDKPSQNGDDSVSSPSPAAASTGTSNQRPKQPPPPLPKNPPKGPAGNKGPPPPLPKTPPRGPTTVRSPSTCSKSSLGTQSSTTSLRSNHTNQEPVAKATSTPDPNRSSALTTWFVPDINDSDIPTGNSVEKEVGNDGHQAVKIRPSPRTSSGKKLVKSQAVSEDNGADTQVPSQESQTNTTFNSVAEGSSSITVKHTDSPAKVDVSDSERSHCRSSSPEVQKDGDGNLVEISVVTKKEEQEGTVTYRKPPPLRTPPPPPPKKSPHVSPKVRSMSKTGTSADNSHVINTNSSSSELSNKSSHLSDRSSPSIDSSLIDGQCINTFHEKTPPKAVNISQNNSSLREEPCVTPDKGNSLEADWNRSETGPPKSPGSQPVPTPRKPAVKPRPTPRPAPRTSIHRLSSTDDSPNLMTCSVHNLSFESSETTSTSVGRAKSVENLTSGRNVFSVWQERQDSPKSPVKSPSHVNRFFHAGLGHQKEAKVSSKSGSESSLKVSSSESLEGLDKAVLRHNFEKKIVDEKLNEHSPAVSELRRFLERSPSPSDSGKTSVPNSRPSPKQSPKVSPKPSPKVSPKPSPKLSPKPPPKHSTPNPINTSGGQCSRSGGGGKGASGGNASDRDEASSPSGLKSGSAKGSFEDLLDDSILQPSSLLNEIEEILSRSYKHCSLTRAGSSPEKTSNVQLRVHSSPKKHERSQSFDIRAAEASLEAAPIRPPRPKRQQRLRSLSQICYDSAGSDTESLSEYSRSSAEEKSLTGKSKSLGPAKPHPPKPKRHKLSVQRSQSDISAMKSFVDKHDQERGKESRKSPHKRQSSEGGMLKSCGGNESPGSRKSNTSSDGAPTPELEHSRPSRKLYPARKAPPPPPAASKPLPPTRSGSLSLDTVVYVDTKDSHKKEKLHKRGEKTSSALYYRIEDGEAPISSEEDHDYHEIPDDMNTADSIDVSYDTGMEKVSSPTRSCGTPVRPPPRLPPRNFSPSFESSSPSSGGHEFPDNSSLDGGSRVSQMSIQSGSTPGSHDSQVQDQPPSSESDDDEDVEEKKKRKREKKLFLIAEEIMTSERVFVDVLVLLNVDFRKHISNATEEAGREVIPTEALNRILSYLPQLQVFNEQLLKDLEKRIEHWADEKKIADIFIKKGQFLKMYSSSYIKDFEIMTSALDDALKKYPAFQTALKEFEMSPRCAMLGLKHYMLKPVQRIPQYKMFMNDYIKHMDPDSPEMEDMATALRIVSEVADHANESLKHREYVQKMLEIQQSLIGQFDVIAPGRNFVKEGELMKLSRKELQPRFFFLFSDVLLYTTPVVSGYRLKHVIPLAGMKVSANTLDEFKTEFSIISTQRSFSVTGSSEKERDDWVSALNCAIEENIQKRGTFGRQTILKKDHVPGDIAPPWIPDNRVTMCLICTSDFTLTWRRHHCRACGKVVCANCSDFKAPLKYKKNKQARVCVECYKVLVQDKDTQDGTSEKSEKTPPKDSSRFTIFRRNHKDTAKSSLLREVLAGDPDADITGYLRQFRDRQWQKLWFLVKHNVLYTFKASNDSAADCSSVILGYEVSTFTEPFEGVEANLVFQLSHKNTAPLVFRTESSAATDRWVSVLKEATMM